MTSISASAAQRPGGGLVSRLHRLGPRAAPAVYLVGCLGLIAAMGAPFTFPLDDSYIHLALARTLATTGVWGATPGDPAAVSSSPLWSLILAAVYLVSPQWLHERFELMPVVLNAAASLAVIRLWRTMLSGVEGRDGWVLLLVLAVPLSAISLLGMEHVLHLLIASLLAFCISRAIARDAEVSYAEALGMAGLAALAVACRYETLFLIGPLGLVALWFRRPAIGVALAAGAALPILAFGALWLHAGGFFLPNALLIKGAAPADASGFASIIEHLSSNISENLKIKASVIALSGLGFAAVALLLITKRYRLPADPKVILLLCSLTATVAQFVFAAVGWLYRYEAWLIGLDLVAIIPFLPLVERRNYPLGRILVAVLAVAVAPRAIDDFVTTALAAGDRRLEHIAPARFLREHYAGRPVVVNDLGAVAYFSRVHPLDMFGLGSNEPVRLRRQSGGYDAKAVQAWAEQNHAAIAVLQVCWKEVLFRLPDQWRLVALWHIPRNVVLADHWIGFFAVGKDEEARLRAGLESFPVPPAISVSYPAERPSLAAMMRSCVAE